MNSTRSLAALLAILILLSACNGSAGDENTPTATGDAPFRVGDKASDVFRIASSGFTVTFDWREGSPIGLPGTWVLRQSDTTRRWDSTVGRGVPDGGNSTAWNYLEGEIDQNPSIISCSWGRDKSDAGRLNTHCERRRFPSSVPDTVLLQSLYDLIQERLGDREILGERAYCWIGAFADTICVTRDGIPLYFKSPITPGKPGTEWEELVATSISRVPPVMSSADELAARVGTGRNWNNVAASDLELPEFGTPAR